MLGPLGWKRHYRLFVLQNRGCKVNKNAFNSQCPSIPTANNDTVISSGCKMGHRQWCLLESQRLCTQWMYFCDGYSERATHHVEQGCVQWKSIMLWCIDMHHLDSWQVTEDGLEAETLGFVWFSVSFIKDEAWFMWSVPTGDDGTHENKRTAHRHRYLGSARYKDDLSLSVCRCCSQTKIGSALNIHA